MTPELATDQAQGIIIRDALTTLICSIQFGTTVLLLMKVRYHSMPAGGKTAEARHQVITPTVGIPARPRSIWDSIA